MAFHGQIVVIGNFLAFLSLLSLWGPTVRGPWTVRRGPQSVGVIGSPQDQNGPLGPKFAGDPRGSWDLKWPKINKFHLYGLDPLVGSRTTKNLASPKLAGEAPHADSSPQRGLGP